MKNKIALSLLFLFMLPPLYGQQSTSGNITAQGTTCATTNACVLISPPSGTSTAVVQLSGTFSATLQFEITADGTNWVAALGTVVGSTSTATSATTAGAWRFTASGVQSLRVRCSTYVSGTVVVQVNASNGSSGGGGGGGSGTITSSTANQIAVYTDTTTVAGQTGFTYLTGALSLPAAGTLGSADTGTPTLTFGTNSITTNHGLISSSGNFILPAGGALSSGDTSTPALTFGTSTVGTNVPTTIAPGSINGVALTVTGSSNAGNPHIADFNLSGGSGGNGFYVDHSGNGQFAGTLNATVSFSTGTAPTGTAGTGGVMFCGDGTAPSALGANVSAVYCGSATNSVNIMDNAVDMGPAAAFNEINLFTPTARTSGANPYFQWTIPADTGLTAATEAPGFRTVTATRTWADGTVATQRENLFVAPTYAKTTTSATFTKAATLAISGAPIAGSGVTITNPYTLWVQAGTTELDGSVVSTGIIKGGNTVVLTADSGNITATTAATAVTVFTLPTLLPNTNYAVHCSGTTTQATAGAGIGIAVKTNTTAATDMEFHALVNTGATAINGQSSGLLSTTTESAIYTGVTGTVTTQLPWTVDGSIEVGATAPTSTVIGFFSISASDAVVVKRDGYCSVVP